MNRLERELDRARDLDVGDLADAIQSIGFECTRCGACCKGFVDDGNEVDGDSVEADSVGVDVDDTVGDGHEHTATVFPDEVRTIQESTGYDWRDVARPMPYGLVDGPDGPEGETFEWAVQTDSCGDCTFYAETAGTGTCTVHADRPLICQTYPFSVALGGTSQPMGEAVDEAGVVRAHECEGLGRDISRGDAEALARTLKTRAVRDLHEAIGVRDTYAPTRVESAVVVHDSEGAKRPDGTPRR